MSITERVIRNLEERREKVLSGRINCIPSPFKRFSADFPGIEQGFYYIVTGQTKAAKTQIANYLFIYNSILYAYTQKKIRLKIFYYPLEESKEAIALRFLSFILYITTGGQCRKSAQELKSVRETDPLDEETLNLIRSERIQNLLKYFEDHIEFVDRRNPTSIWKEATTYADNHGKSYYKDYCIKNSSGEIVQSGKQFDYYVPNDPDEYVIFFIDHIGLIDTEAGLDLRESIGKLSQYLVKIRNRYNYIPVVVQQQSTETGSLAAYKANKIRPTQVGLADNKATAKDATVMLGITNPYAFEIPNDFGYDITKLKANARFLEVVLSREGESNGLLGLYFDGAVNYFEELPRPDNHVELQAVYNKLEGLKQKQTNVLLHIRSLFKKIIKKDNR